MTWDMLWTTVHDPQRTRSMPDPGVEAGAIPSSRNAKPRRFRRRLWSSIRFAILAHGATA